VPRGSLQKTGVQNKHLKVGSKRDGGQRALTDISIKMSFTNQNSFSITVNVAHFDCGLKTLTSAFASSLIVPRGSLQKTGVQNKHLKVGSKRDGGQREQLLVVILVVLTER
jgi:hypothetical protein